MEEKTKIEKNTIQVFEPVEVKVVEIAPQRFICESKALTVERYDLNDFSAVE